MMLQPAKEVCLHFLLQWRITELRGEGRGSPYGHFKPRIFFIMKYNSKNSYTVILISPTPALEYLFEPSPLDQTTDSNRP